MLGRPRSNILVPDRRDGILRQTTRKQRYLPRASKEVNGIHCDHRMVSERLESRANMYESTKRKLDAKKPETMRGKVQE